MRTRRIIALTLLLAGCAARQDLSPLASLPYREDGGLFLVESQINDSAPAWFMVDSGSPTSVIDRRLQRQIGLRITGVGSMTGTGEGAVPVQYSEPVRLRIGDVGFNVPRPVILDLSALPIDKETRGIIGSEVFKTHVVRLDPLRKRFEIFDPAEFRHTREGSFLPLFAEGPHLYTKVTLEVRPGLTVTDKVRIETAHLESINHPIVERAIIRRKTEQGNGLGSNFVAWSGQMNAVHIGPYVIRDVWGPGSPTPSIGMEMLRRFVVTFDLPRGRLHLRPTPALSDPVPAPD